MFAVANDLMSFGMHRIWKQRLLNIMRPSNDQSLIDVGCGTGDICDLFSKHTTKNTKILAIDPNINMIEKCKKRLAHLKNLDLELGTFPSTPFEVGDSFSPGVIVQPGVPADARPRAVVPRRLRLHSRCHAAALGRDQDGGRRTGGGKATEHEEFITEERADQCEEEDREWGMIDVAERQSFRASNVVELVDEVAVGPGEGGDPDQEKGEKNE